MDGGSGPPVSLITEALDHIWDAVMIFEVAADGRTLSIAFVNQSFESQTGWTLDEVNGKSPRLLQSPKSDDEVLTGLGNAIAEGLPVQATFINQRKDGSEFWVELRLRPFRAADGRVTHYVSVRRDVTAEREREAERRRTIEVLRDARDRAQEGTRSRQAFLAAMSHELRTPLHGVLGAAQVLCDTSLDPRQVKFVRMLTESAGTLLDRIGNVLDFSQLEAGQVQLQESPVVLRRMLEDAVAVVEPVAAQKGLVLVVDVDPELAPIVTLDALRCGQILTNLLGNAVKFTARGRVVLRAAPGGDDLLLEVKDTGPGVPAEFLESVFEPFLQADSSLGRMHEGAGLGLAIVRQLTRFMGGDCKLASSQDSGTVVTVLLPLREADSEPVPTLDVRVGVVDGDAIRGAATMRLIAAVGAQPVNVVDADVVLVDVDATCPGGIGGRQLRVGRLGGQESVSLVRPLRAQVLHELLGKPVDRTEPVPSAPVSLALSVLVAEDNATNQAIVRAMLMRFGITPYVVGCGEDAVAAAEQSDFDLILMDIQMPGIGGLEATRMLVRRLGTRCPPVIALTANVLIDQVQQMFAAGMSAHLPKPLTMEALERTLLDVSQASPSEDASRKAS